MIKDITMQFEKDAKKPAPLNCDVIPSLVFLPPDKPDAEKQPTVPPSHCREKSHPRLKISKNQRILNAKQK